MVIDLIMKHNGNRMAQQRTTYFADKMQELTQYRNGCFIFGAVHINVGKQDY